MEPHSPLQHRNRFLITKNLASSIRHSATSLDRSTAYLVGQWTKQASSHSTSITRSHRVCLKPLCNAIPRYCSVDRTTSLNRRSCAIGRTRAVNSRPDCRKIRPLLGYVRGMCTLGAFTTKSGLMSIPFQPHQSLVGMRQIYLFN